MWHKHGGTSFWSPFKRSHYEESTSWVASCCAPLDLTQHACWGLALHGLLLPWSRVIWRLEPDHTCPLWDSSIGPLCSETIYWPGWDVFRVSLQSTPPPAQFSFAPLCAQLSALQRGLRALPAHFCSLSPAPFTNLFLFMFYSDWHLCLGGPKVSQEASENGK